MGQCWEPASAPAGSGHTTNASPMSRLLAVTGCVAHHLTVPVALAAIVVLVGLQQRAIRGEGCGRAWTPLPPGNGRRSRSAALARRVRPPSLPMGAIARRHSRGEVGKVLRCAGVLRMPRQSVDETLSKHVAGVPCICGQKKTSAQTRPNHVSGRVANPWHQSSCSQPEEQTPLPLVWFRSLKLRPRRPRLSALHPEHHRRNIDTAPCPPPPMPMSGGGGRRRQRHRCRSLKSKQRPQGHRSAYAPQTRPAS